MNRDSKITIHMVSSLDGKIAKPDNRIEWFETTDNYEKGVSEPESMPASVDCYVMGSKTYELALSLSKNYGWPYGDTPTYVLTKRTLPVERASVKFYHDGLEKLFEDLKENYSTIWIVGGAALTKSVLEAKLADEFSIMILPVFLGEGLPFFEQVKAEFPLHLKQVNAYKNGMVELSYQINR